MEHIKAARRWARGLGMRLCRICPNATACLLLGMTLLSGCVTNRAVVPRNSDLSTLAHVSTDTEKNGFFSASGRSIHFVAVDGKELGGYWTGPAPTDIYLTPGRHTLKVTYANAGTLADATIKLDAQPGIQYHLHQKVVGYGIRFWLTAGNDQITKISTGKAKP